MIISYDSNADIVEIEKIKYSGEIFRRFGGIGLTQKNECLRIVEDKNFVLVLKLISGCSHCEKEFGGG